MQVHTLAHKMRAIHTRNTTDHVNTTPVCGESSRISNETTSFSWSLLILLLLLFYLSLLLLWFLLPLMLSCNYFCPQVSILKRANLSPSDIAQLADAVEPIAFADGENTASRRRGRKNARSPSGENLQHMFHPTDTPPYS